MTARLKPYAAYKESGVPWLGRVPAHWDLRSAWQAYRPRAVKNTGMAESTVLSLSYGNLVVRPASKLRGLVPESFETYQIVEPGNVIVRTTDLQNDRRSLRVGFCRQRGIITSAYLCLEARSGIAPSFGYQVLNAYDHMGVLYGFGSGLRQNLSFADIKRMAVPVPAAPEQFAIVRFLEAIGRRLGRYVRSKQKLIALLTEQKQAIIQRAVTRGLDPSAPMKPSGIEWVREIPRHWRVRSFTRCAVERADYRGATPEKTDSGTFLVTAKNIRKGWIDYDASREFVSTSDYLTIMRRGLPRIGDLLFTTEAPLGNAALVDREDVALAQRVIRFRLDPDALVPAFALYSVLSPYFQDQVACRGTGSTAEGIKASKLPQLQILCPPLEEQHQIVARVAQKAGRIDGHARRTLRAVELVRELRARLIADVITGKLDVRGVAAQLPDEDGRQESPFDDGVPEEAENVQVGAEVVTADEA